MKTLSENIDVEVSGEEESASLQIDANAKAFKELISGIYSDKVYAICRELTANAWDSHKMKGNTDRPFELHLPTVFEPHFSIRDFGVSMSYAVVMDLYRHLFKSSKDDENDENANDFVGKFGLGSKTPFAYTDSFMLTTYLDKVVRQYDIYFGKKGPVLSMMLEDETDEEDGVMVSFPVKEKDMEDFARAAARALEPYTVLPIMTGRKVVPPVRQVMASGNGWKLLDNTETGAMEALQGTVLYPLSFESIPDCPPRFKPLIQSPFHIDFPIGDLDVVTSRERLSFDERTTKNIINRLHQVADDITASVADALNNATTYFDWCAAYYKLKSSYNSLIWSVIEQNPPKFKGRWTPTEVIKAKIHNKKVYTSVPVSDGAGQIKKQTGEAKRFGDLEVMVIANGFGLGQKLSSTTGLVTKLHYTTNVAVKTTMPVIVIRHDLSKRVTYVSSRINKIFKANRNSLILYIRHGGADDIAAMKRLFVYLGRPTHTEYSIHDIEPEVTTTRRYTKDAFKVWHRGDWRTPEESVVAALSDGSFTGEVWALDTERGTPTHRLWNRIPVHMTGLYESLKDHHGFDPAKDILIGIPKNMQSKHAEYRELYHDPIEAFVQRLASSYDRSLAALNSVTTSLSYDRNGKLKRSHGRVSAPIFDMLPEIRELWTRYCKSNPKLPSFDAAVAGTVFEDVIFWKKLVDEARDQKAAMEAYCGYNGARVEAEKKLVAKETSQHVHAMNVAGGKVHKELPILWAMPRNLYDRVNLRVRYIGRELERVLTA